MRFALLMTLLCFFAAPAVHAAAGVDVNVNVLAGQKQMAESDDWGDVDGQTIYGLMADVNIPVLPTIALDIIQASESSGGVDIDVLEVDLGIRMYLDIVPVITPYGGLGVSWLQTEAEIESDGLGKNDSDGYGYWFDVGVVYRIAERINIGLDLRYSGADVDDVFEGQDTDMSGYMYSIFAGLHF